MSGLSGRIRKLKGVSACDASGQYIGRWIKWGLGQWMQVVGVVEDPDEEPCEGYDCCPKCGSEMIDAGTYSECSVCDYADYY